MGLMMLKKVAKITLGVAALCVGIDGHFKVEQGHQAVVSNPFQYKEKVFTKGRYLKIPWYERVKIYDVRERSHIVEAATSTREMNMVKVRIEVRAHPRQMLTFVHSYGEEYDGTMNALTKFALNNVWTTRYSYEQLQAEKESISSQIQLHLTAELEKYDIVIDNVCITSITDNEDIDYVENFIAGTNGVVELM